MTGCRELTDDARGVIGACGDAVRPGERSFQKLRSPDLSVRSILFLPKTSSRLELLAIRDVINHSAHLGAAVRNNQLRDGERLRREKVASFFHQARSA
jgi:hypothetical protein